MMKSFSRTIINFSDNKSVSEIKDYLLKVCQETDAVDKLKTLVWDHARDIGIIISKRVVNLSSQLLPPLYDGLFDEIAWATEDEPTEELRNSFRFNIYLVISKIYKHRNADQLKGTSQNGDEVMIFIKPEDEILLKMDKQEGCPNLLLLGSKFLNPTSLITGYGQELRQDEGKHYSVALSMFVEMRQWEIRVDHYTLGTAINCCCHLSLVDYGFSIFGHFFKRGYRTDAPVFSTLMKGIFLEDKIPEAVELFRLLVQKKLCVPTEIMLRTLMNGLSKAGHTLVVRDMMVSLENRGYNPGIRAYNSVINYLCKDKMVDEALQVLSRMDGKSVSPDVFTYNSLIKGLCDLGRWKEVKGLISDMVSHKISLDLVTYNTLVDAFCKEGLMKEAEDMLDVMKEINIVPDVFTFGALIDGYCLVGQIDKARTMFDSVHDSGIHVDITIINSLINGYCKKRMMNEAWTLFLEIPGRGLKADGITYFTIMLGLIHQGRFVAASKLFSEMLSVGVPHEISAFNAMMVGLCTFQKTDQALALLNTMKNEGLSPDLGTYSIIIKGLCKDGKHDAAIEMLNELPSKGSCPDVRLFTSLIEALCREGILVEAKL